LQGGGKFFEWGAGGAPGKVLRWVKNGRERVLREKTMCRALKKEKKQNHTLEKLFIREIEHKRGRRTWRERKKERLPFDFRVYPEADQGKVTPMMRKKKRADKFIKQTVLIRTHQGGGEKRKTSHSNATCQQA